jgi:heme/copper-type cytochrome/quinol oxidase subunit 1
LRRTFYVGGEFQGYTLAAIIGGVVVSLGFLAFLVNLVSTLGLRNVFSLVVPESWLAGRQEAAAAEAS